MHSIWCFMHLSLILLNLKDFTHFSDRWLPALKHWPTMPVSLRMPFLHNPITPQSPKRGRKAFQKQQAIFEDETSCYYLRKKKSMGTVVLGVTLCLQLIVPGGKLPLDRERCFNILEHRVPLQLSLIYCICSLSSSSNHNRVGLPKLLFG